MEATANKKLNIELPEATEYTLCNVQFLGKSKLGKLNPFITPQGKTFARAKVKILSHIWTVRKNFGANVKISKADFTRVCGCAWSVVNESLKQLKDVNIVSEPKPNVYKILPKVTGKEYFTMDNYLNNKKFNINGKFKKLPASSVLIENYVKAFYLRKDKDGNYINYDFRERKPINYFYASEQGFADVLNLPPSTVSYAIKPLLHLNLMCRNKRLKYKDDKGNTYYKITEIKGVPGNAKSIFVIPYEVLAVELRSTYTPEKVDFIENLEEIEITEEAIEKVYSDLRSEAEAVTANARKTAFNDSEFNAAREELNEAMGAAFAARESGENVQQAKERWNNAQARYLKRLAELGITEEELEAPAYVCQRCRDTGQLDTGQRCRCRANVKYLILSRFFKRK